MPKKPRKCMSELLAQNTKTSFRKCAISLLNDDNGVSEESFDLMYDFLDDDIKLAVDATDGRYYIKEDAIIEDAIKELE